MKKFALALAIVITILGSCKSKEKEEPQGDFFPVVGFIKGEVAHVDSSIASIIKIVTTDSVADTVYLRKEEFKNAAADFLSLPDIASKDLKDNYEQTKLYDDALHKVTFTYLPKNKGEAIQQELVIIKPDPPNVDQVETIFVDELLSNDDSTVQKKMTWQSKNRFKVITIVQKKNEPEKVSNVEVIWKEPSAE